LHRSNHEDCPAGKDTKRRLYTTKKLGGYLWYCHNCGNGGFRHTESVPRLSEYKKKGRVAKKNVLPPSNGQIPKKYKVFLYQYGITNDDITKYNLYYSKDYDRLVFPVLQDNVKICGWSGRGSNPKWYKQTFISKQLLYFVTEHPDLDTVTIVEDPLSAIVVGRDTNAIALLGTYIQKETMVDISNLYSNVKVWLDNDARDKSKKMSVLFNKIISGHAESIVTELDPKCYSDGR